MHGIKTRGPLALDYNSIELTLPINTEAGLQGLCFRLPDPNKGQKRKSSERSEVESSSWTWF